MSVINEVKKEISKMVVFQTKHEVKMLCALNTAYLLSWCKRNNITAECVVGIVENLDKHCYTEHAWVKIQGKVYDPSAQFALLRNKAYHTYREAMARRVFFRGEDLNFVKGNISRLEEAVQKHSKDFESFEDYEECVLEHNENIKMRLTMAKMAKQGVKVYGNSEFENLVMCGFYKDKGIDAKLIEM